MRVTIKYLLQNGQREQNILIDTENPDEMLANLLHLNGKSVNITSVAKFLSPEELKAQREELMNTWRQAVIDEKTTMGFEAWSASAAGKAAAEKPKRATNTTRKPAKTGTTRKPPAAHGQDPSGAGEGGQAGAAQ